MDDELLDLVDENDNVVGVAKRSVVYENNFSNFRAVNAFLKNSEGKLWIPKRTATKKLFPLCLDASMGGHVSSGETYQQAFEREILEELGLIASEIEYKVIGFLTPHQHNVSAFMYVYEVMTDQTPKYNLDDFIESSWLSPCELLAKIEQGEKSKDDLPKLVRAFYKKID